MHIVVMKLAVVVAFLFSNISFATVFKCIGDDGVIKYQSKNCEDSDKKQVMERVSDVPEVMIYDNPEPSNNKYSLNNQKSPKFSKREIEKVKRDSHNAQCAPYLQQYSKMKRQVKERCKRAKDIYCDLPGDQIEEKNYERDLKFSYRDTPEQRIDGVRIINRRAMKGKLRKPPLLKLKEFLIKNNCI